MKERMTRRKIVEGLSIGALAFAGMLKDINLKAADLAPSQVVKSGEWDEPSEEESLARSARPFFETFPLRFSRKPTLKGLPTVGGPDPFAFPAQPSIARVPDGRLFLAWSTAIGYASGDRIVGAYSSDGGRTWEPPIELINHSNLEDENPVIIVDGPRLMVIAVGEGMPKRIEKLNPWPGTFDRSWWYMASTEDGGQTWSKPVEVKHPHQYANLRGGNGYRLKDGTLVLPYYFLPGVEQGNVPKYEYEMHSEAAMARSKDGGLTWTSGQAVDLHGTREGADEPVTVLLSKGEIFCLLRNSLDRLYEMRSRDGGLTWDMPKPSALPAHSTPAWLHRLENRSGDELVVAWDYLAPWMNPAGKVRSPLVVAHSPDGGGSWSRPKMVSNPNPMQGFRVDYPTICQTKEGLIVLVWMQETLPHHLGKELRVARFNRAWLLAR